MCKKEGFSIKKIKIVVCGVVIFSIVILSVAFFGCQKQKQSFPALNELKEMSGAECLELFEEYGMVLPAEYKDHEEQAEKDVEYILDNMQDTSIPQGVIAMDRAGVYELAEQIEHILGKFSQ